MKENTGRHSFKNSALLSFLTHRKIMGVIFTTFKRSLMATKTSAESTLCIASVLSTLL